MLVEVNLTDSVKAVKEMDAGDCLVSTHSAPWENSILRPYEGRILVIE